MAMCSDALMCAICNESLEDPRHLPCGHSYCGPPRNCLKSMENSEGLLVCAICREEHSLKAENIKPLYGIRDYLQRDGGKLTSNELVCLSHQNMECGSWCCDCDNMICGTCFENDHDRHFTRPLKRHLQEEVRLKFGSSLFEGLSGHLSSSDAVIQKKEAELALLRFELSAARSHKEFVSDVLNHLQQETPSLSTLWKLVKLDVVDILSIASKNEKSDTQTQTSQVTSSTQTGNVNYECRASSTSDLDATMGVNNCKKCGVDHGPNVLSEFPVLRDISLRVIRRFPLEFESSDKFSVCPYKFQLHSYVE